MFYLRNNIKKIGLELLIGDPANSRFGVSREKFKVARMRGGDISTEKQKKNPVFNTRFFFFVRLSLIKLKWSKDNIRPN